MRTIIHDLNINDIKKFSFNKTDYVVSANECQNNCIGCFSCWIKHPKTCIYKDAFSNLTDKIKDSDELIIISKNRFGCYSTKIKRVFERCIGYVLPYFCIRNNMIHHTPRYNKQIVFHTIFYGNITNEDKTCLYNLTKANSINLNAKEFKVTYYNDIKEIYNAYFN